MFENLPKFVVFTGEGGVGKTTMAAAITAALAARGHDVLLATTDPAAHPAATLGERVPRPTVSRRHIVRHAEQTAAGRIVTPMTRLQDAEGTEILVVTLPERRRSSRRRACRTTGAAPASGHGAGS
jgi:CO dehydrogenase nickel-insertion accessory protein CooC1